MDILRNQNNIGKTFKHKKDFEKKLNKNKI